MTYLPTYVPAGLAASAVDPDEGDIRRMLCQKGMRVYWEQYTLCPCSTTSYSLGSVTTNLDAPDADCEYCGTLRYIYVDGQQILGVHQMARTRLEWYRDLGSMGHGSIMMTFLPENTPGYLDRCTLMDAIMVYTEVRERKTTTEQTRYPIVKHTMTVGGAADPSVMTEVTVGVQSLRAADASGVSGPLLVEGTDFTLTAIGGGSDGYSINWSLGDTAGTAPPVGGRYAVRYYAHPRYLVVDHAHAFRAKYSWGADVLQRVDLPTTALLQLEHLANPVGNGSPPVSEHGGL